MRLNHGDRLRCSNPTCGLQVIVSDLGMARDSESLLRCICGAMMKKVHAKTTVSPLNLEQKERARSGQRGPWQ